MPGPKHEYHSLEQVSLIDSLCKKSRLHPRESLFLVTQLVNHGSTQAKYLIERLREEFHSIPVQEYLSRLQKRDAAIQSLKSLKEFMEDREIVNELYKSNGITFRPGSYRRDIAIVIFTTKFNNLTFSNLVVDAIFDELGVSRLFLRDTSDYVYMRGIMGLAESLIDIPEAISRLLHDKEVRHAIITGYSSGGYPSLYVATKIKHCGYTGFSVSSNISHGTELPKRSMYESIRAEVDDSLFKDIKNEFKTGGVSRYVIHYGNNNVVDRAHAEYLDNVEGVEVICHKNSGHEVNAYLMEEGLFYESFYEHIKSAESNY